jgi:hypothetical protein
MIIDYYIHECDSTSEIASQHIYDFPVHADGLSDEAKKFSSKLAPCCVRAYDTGYCGQRSPSGERLYDLCENPDKFFYWDEMHPTNAGWKAVMKSLEESLKEFLGRGYVP